MRLIWGLATLACGAGDERLTFYPVSEDTTLVHYAYTSSELPDALLDLMEASHFEAFDASLARGLRAQVPQLPMRPRGLFVAATGDGHWPMLTHGLSGLLCGSFSTLARPMWFTRELTAIVEVAPGHRANIIGQYTSENVCTENLTPLVKLLPCSRLAGLASRIRPYDFAESQYRSLGLKVWKAADLWTYRVEVVYIATKSHVLHSDSASCYGVRSEVVETDSAVSAVSQTPRVTKRYLDAPYVRSRSSQVVQVQSGDVRLRGVYWDWVPPFFVQEFHRLRMTTGNGTLHGSAAFDALKFQYAMQDDADAPITFQFYVDLEPHETLQVEFPLEKRFLHASYWTEVADLGSEIPQGVLFDSEGARHFTRPAVTRLPSPDFSFIFNGIALGCFIMALYMTQVTRILVVAPDSAGSRSSPISQLARLVKSVIRHVIIRVKH